MRYASSDVVALRPIFEWLCVLGLLLPLPRGRAQAFQRQNFTTDDGLPQNSVHAVLQTRDGFLWAATEGGAVRFDGVKFARFGTENEAAFPSNDSCCLAQTADDMLWIGTSDGLVRWSGTRFDRVNTGPVLQMIAEPRGTLLVLAAQGLLRVSSLASSVVVLPGGREATALGQDEHGAPLLAAGALLLRPDGEKFTAAGSLPVAPLELFQVGGFWLRSATEVWNEDGDASQHWRIGEDLPGSRLLSISHADRAVFASTNRGVFRLMRGSAPQPVAEMEGTPVLSATVDHEGDLWLGTDTAGLAVLRSRAVQTVPALAAEAITSVVQTTDGTLWVGTRDSGLKAMPSGAREPRSMMQGSILSLAPGRDGDLWIGTPDGLDYLHHGTLTHASSADGLPDDFVRSLLPDGQGNVWVGTRHGAAHWQVGRAGPVLTTADGLPSDVVGTMLQDAEGTLWFGTLHGLAKLHGGQTKPVPLVGGLPGDSITALLQAPDGTLLAGTHSGVIAFARPGGPFAAMHVSGIQGEIDALLLDAEGNLWVRTGVGIQRLMLRDLLQCRANAACSPAVRTYGTADNMPSLDTSSDGHPSAWRASDGVLWFATRRGIARVDAAHLPIDHVAPPVVVERVQVDGAEFSPDGPLAFGPGHRRFVFDFAALSLRAPLQVSYRFRLDGFDRDWIGAGNRRSAEYTNLPPGSYRLQVEARNADGVPSVTPAELQFTIAAPLYRRWWFYVLLLVAAAAGVYVVYRLRLRRVQREFDAVLNERNRIAREIHDTLAQDFVAVSLQLEVTAQLLNVNATEAARQQIDSTRLLVRDGIRDARDSIWALRAGKSAGDLPARLRQMVEAAPVLPSQTLLVTGSYRALAPSVEKELLRIAKEAMGNAVRHAAAGGIVVSLVYSEDAVILTVRDDGAGFDVASGTARTGHYGLRGMDERAAALGAVFSIASRPGEGTTVSLRLET